MAVELLELASMLEGTLTDLRVSRSERQALAKLLPRGRPPTGCALSSARSS